MIYQVKDWNEHYENNKSRERNTCSYACVPNKQHGLGFARIMMEIDGAAIYGIFQCIIGACSQQKKPRNGWLTEDGHQTGTPWAPIDLAVKFRRPEAEIKRALDILTSPRIGWMIGTPTQSEVLESTMVAISAQQVPASCPPSVDEVPLRKEGRKERKNTMSGSKQPDHADEIEVLTYLNQKACRQFEMVDGSLKHIRARLKEGATVQKCKAIIDDRIKAWKSKPEMQEYLRPKTLFSSENFSNYSGQINTKPKSEVRLPSVAQLEARYGGTVTKVTPSIPQLS